MTTGSQFFAFAITFVSAIILPLTAQAVFSQPKLEYLYLDLGTVSTVPAPAMNATVATAFNSRVTDNVVRVGVNYKFNPNQIWAND